KLEPADQPVKVSLRQLFVSPVDAPGGKPAGAFIEVMLGHDSNDPARGPNRPPRHSFPRRATRGPRRSRRRIIQVDREGTLAAVSGHRHMPRDLLQIPEYSLVAFDNGAVAQLEARKA